MSLVSLAGTVTAVSASGQTGQWNANGPNYDNGSIGTNWSNAQTEIDSSAEWVNDGYVGSRTNGTTLVYTQLIYVTGTPTGNTIVAMCSDTCQVQVNGNTVKAYDTSCTEYYGGCDTIGNRFNTKYTGTNVSGFVSGWNVVTFTTKKVMQTAPQGASTYSGVAYKVSVTYSTTCGC